MRAHDRRTSDNEHPSATTGKPAAAPEQSQIMRMQQGAGNQAVSAMLARTQAEESAGPESAQQDVKPGDAAPAPDTAPPAETQEVKPGEGAGEPMGGESEGAGPEAEAG